MRRRSTRQGARSPGISYPRHAGHAAGGRLRVLGQIPSGVDSVALFHQLLEEQICLTPGTLYSPSGRYRSALRHLLLLPVQRALRSAGSARRQGLHEMSGLPPGACAGRVTARAFATMPVSLISVPFGHNGPRP